MLGQKNKMYPFLIIFVVAIQIQLFLLPFVQSVDAATLGREWSLQAAVQDAEAIFEGTVIRVDFRDSEATQNYSARLPHTFVTYRVGRVLHGKLVTPEVTLRFMGGWSSETGRIMVVSGGPLFMSGNRDILFVAKNGKSVCPLIACGLGRFRVVNNTVYSNSGHVIQMDANGGLRFGPTRLAEAELVAEFPPAPASRLRAVREELAENTALSEAERTVLQRRLAAMSAPRVISLARGGSQEPTPLSQPAGVSVEGLMNTISRISAQSTTVAGMVDSVSWNEPFSVAPMKLAPSQRSGRPAVTAARPTLEQQLLRRNHGNPVIGGN